MIGDKKSFKDLFPETNDDLLEILEDMLCYNPVLRPTAKELLAYKIFDKVRIEDNEY
jgi:serine/threonine protein kinase